MAAESKYFKDSVFGFPKPLVEIGDKSMIQLVVENLQTIKDEKRFIFILSSEDCEKFHLDNVVKLLTDDCCEIIKISGDTKGAACSTLMAVAHINNDRELIIVNNDQIFDCNLNDVLGSFRADRADAGVITFETVHPRWSYVGLEQENKVIEAAEKKPISRHGIAGFYYFKQGAYFVSAAMQSIKKGASVNGLFYISPVLNEMILANQNVVAQEIDKNVYHTFYTPQKIAEYERLLNHGVS
jgi:dTDP-glucose pyrophosphorylase